MKYLVWLGLIPHHILLRYLRNITTQHQKNIMAFILLHKEHCHKFLLEIFKILFAMSTRNEEQFERRERSSF